MRWKSNSLFYLVKDDSLRLLNLPPTPSGRFTKLEEIALKIIVFSAGCVGVFVDFKEKW